MAEAQEMEIIELVSDEELSATKYKKNKSPKIFNNNCINFKCKSGKSMRVAPSFACIFYGSALSKKKKRLICDDCFDAALRHQEDLVDCLVNRKSLLKCDFPDHTMEVEISDSDDSDEEELTCEQEEDDYIPEDVLLDIEEKMDSTLSMIFKKYDINYQIEQASAVLKQQWDTIDESNEEMDKNLTKMMSKMDRLRNNLYKDFKPQIKMLPELNIDRRSVETPAFPLVATKKVTQMRVLPLNMPDGQPEILPLDGVETPLLVVDLPPSGPLVKLLPEAGDLVYIMKHPLSAWVKARIVSIQSRTPLQYRVKLLTKKGNSVFRVVFGTQLALATPSSVLIPVGTRIVAIFKDVNDCGYYSGVIAEEPKSTNKYRYLVFFDDGYAQYVIHKDILLVNEWSTRVWEGIPKESREFVKKYMESYPERPMVKLQPGQVVKTEWNAKWWIAKVLQIDASLVQMHFIADERTEWIYRGSARLGPLFDELVKANARQHGHHAPLNNASHRFPAAINRNNIPYVEYTSFKPEPYQEMQPADESESTKIETQTGLGSTTVSSSNGVSSSTPSQTRAVARKSTSKKQAVVDASNVTASMNTGSNTKPSHSIVYYQTQNKIPTRKYVPHKCGSDCVRGISFTPDNLRGYSPLSIPLLCGWNRQLCKYPKMKKVILYQAPCGIRLRTMEELHQYLRVTGSPMSVDLFDFDYWVHCLAEFVLDKCFVNIKDLSYGVENVLIPCVNELDHALPDTIRYSTQRQPTEGVNLNLDPEFLCGCDCEDDCQDKEKCACWQLTIQGATFGGRVPDTAVGYVYKRLPDAVATGIYECNSRCKCSVKTCLNRVVQHPLTLKLQVFKTGPRGWGIRCLNDIPHGSFICIYAGTLLTEQGANEGGKNYGDEYLAELDYVEAVEGIKEGYESDVPDSELRADITEEVNEKSAVASEEDDDAAREALDSDEDFNIGKNINLNVDLSTSIRKRLRKRKKGEGDDRGGSEETSEDGSTTKDSENSSIKPTAMSQDEQRADCDLITISDDEDDANLRREPSRFEPSVKPVQVGSSQSKSVREYFGEDEAVYIMDAKTTGNIGRYLNHSCEPNVFVQNVFVDTHDVRFPWVAFFALNYIRSGQELTWNYNYDVGSIPGKVILCRCGSSNCRGRLL